LLYFLSERIHGACLVLMQYALPPAIRPTEGEQTQQLATQNRDAGQHRLCTGELRGQHVFHRRAIVTCEGGSGDAKQ
jgi:hypothetical protein